jgi:energy-coupling factor transporter ATP-binding protein EcfA2
VSAAPPERPADPTRRLAIDPCLERLDRAIEAARALGIATADADAVRSDAAARLGFPSDAYVLALVGGTGVGKSSLLNALAGAEVSRASVLRPTTDRPVAWLPASSAGELTELLDWLGVAPEDVHQAGESEIGGVAVLDLPDLDSTSPEHRERVEAVLPRVDAVVWVTDPEKYADAVLQDEFLARWLPRLARQIVVVNKGDRLTPEEAEAVRGDLERDLARLAATGDGDRRAPRVRVVVAAAAAASSGRGGATGIDEIRGWLAEQVETKAVVRSRLVASIRDAVLGLARAAGIDPESPVRPLLGEEARRRAVEGATAALLRIVDLPRLERQAMGATRARARARGAGPLGGLTSLIYRWSGRQSQVADPVAFVARWRDRGPLGPAVEPIRAAFDEPLRTAPTGTRQLLARAVAADRVERDLAGAVDRAVAMRGDEVPSSRVWPVLGLLQTVATLALVITAIWVALWVFVKFPVDSIVLPVVGRAPAPFVVLIVVLAAGYLLARALGLHAGWVGRRWARRLAADIQANVEREVASRAFAAVDALETERLALWAAGRGIGADCRAE